MIDRRGLLVSAAALGAGALLPMRAFAQGATGEAAKLNALLDSRL